MFGAMFAPRPERVASELVRVCKPGGVIAMANWTPDGFVGKSFQITSKMLPPPPGISAPVLWGDEATVRGRFSSGVSGLKMTRQKFWFHYPFNPGGDWWNSSVNILARRRSHSPASTIPAKPLCGLKWNRCGQAIILQRTAQRGLKLNI